VPTVIDSLVLELGLDPSKFTRGAQESMRQLRTFEEQAVRSARGTETAVNKVVGTLDTLRRGFLGGLAAIVGGFGFKHFIDNVANLDAATGRLAHTMDMSVRDVSAWQGGMKQAGGTAEGASAALAGLSGEMNRFQLTGQSQMLGVLSRLGISLYDQNRNLKTSGQLWLELSDAISGMDPAAAKAFLQMIPGANQEMINFALMGRLAMEQYIKNAREAGTATDESTQAAKRYQAAVGQVDNAWTNLWRNVVTTSAGFLSGTMNAATSILAQITNAPGAREAAARSRLEDASGMVGLENWLRGKLGMAPMGVSSEQRTAGLELLGARMQAARAPAAAASASAHWENFLSGLSFLETSHTGAPSTQSSARGFFQFTSATRRDAIGAGIPDPAVGDYGAQRRATEQFIRRFHPDAAAALDRGDFSAAVGMLNQRWPSLPGGSQATQSAGRYATFREELRGGGPRPPGAGTTVSIGTINIQTQATDAPGIARDIGGAIDRGVTAGAANHN
jgi:hypothetical protein